MKFCVDWVCSLKLYPPHSLALFFPFPQVLIPNFIMTVLVSFLLQVDFHSNEAIRNQNHFYGIVGFIDINLSKLFYVMIIIITSELIMETAS